MKEEVYTASEGDKLFKVHVGTNTRSGKPAAVVLGLV